MTVSLTPRSPTVPFSGLCFVLAAVACDRAPGVAFFRATPAELPVGGGVTRLQWEVTGASSVLIEPGLGELPASGELEAKVERSQCFVLSVRSASRAEACVRVATVEGIVVDHYGSPLARASVKIADEIVLTDLDGRFALFGQHAPSFDVRVKGPARGPLTYYPSLRSPTLHLVAIAQTPSRVATISGRVHGVEPGSVGVVSLSAGPLGRATSTDQEGAFTGRVGWSGGNAIGRGTALVAEIGPDYLPVRYRGFGKGADVPLQDGGVVMDYSIQTSLVDQGEVHVSVPVPPGYRPAIGTLHVASGDRTSDILFQAVSPSGDFRFIAPSHPDLNIAVTVSAGEAASAGVANTAIVLRDLEPGSSTVTATFRMPPTLVSPEAGTRCSFKEGFRWSDASPGVYALELQSIASGTRVYVISDRPEVALADDSPLANVLERGQKYAWRVYAHGPEATIHDAIKPPGLVHLLARPGGSTIAVSARRECVLQ